MSIINIIIPIIDENPSLKGDQMIYHTIDEIPAEGRYLIIEMINKGIIDSNNGKIDLEDVIYKILIILARLGLI